MPRKPIAFAAGISIYILGVLLTFFFVYSDVAFLAELTGKNGETFSTHSELEPWVDQLFIWIFLVLTALLHSAIIVSIVKAKYMRTLLFSIGLVGLFLFQFIFWSVTTLQGP